MATKISLKQLGQDILDLIKSGGSGTGEGALIEDITSNVPVGAAAAGTLFEEDTTFTEFAKRILRKDIVPAISFSASGTGVYELGHIVNGSTLKLTITNLGGVTVPINTILFKVNSTVVSSQPFVLGQNIYSFVYSEPIGSNMTVRGELVYNTNQTTGSNATFTFVNPAYYGMVNDSTVNETVVAGLAKSIKISRAFTWSNITMTNQHFCYAYPTSQGNLTSIKDANNFEYLGSYDKIVITINGEDYNVYVLRDKTTVSGFRQIYS